MGAPFDRDPGGPPLLLGVIHLAPLPGAPRHGGSMEALLEAAARDASAFRNGGADAVVVENFGDAPFHPETVPPETIAAMARAVERVAECGLPVGVNVLRNDALAAVGLCAATRASFLRVNVHVGAMVTDQGLLQGRAAETMRALARLAPGATLLADVHVKHASPLVAQPIEAVARDTLGRGGAERVLVSGTGTGSAPDARELERVAAAVGRERVLVGSGLDAANAERLLVHAAGAIVGSSLKEHGELSRPVDERRVARLRAVFDAQVRGH